MAWIVGAVLGVAGKQSALRRRQFYEQVFSGAAVPVASFVYERQEGARPELWSVLVDRLAAAGALAAAQRQQVDVPVAGGAALAVPFDEVELAAGSLRLPLAVCRPGAPRLPWAPPFDSQPVHGGAVNWLDVCTPDEHESAVAGALRAALGWRLSKPVVFPPAHKYITCLRGDTAGRTNGEKLAGVLPRSVLLPMLADRLPPACTVPFFACSSPDVVERAVAAAQSAGGTVALPPFQADGTVAILVDPFGAPFAVYNRTDDWQAVKDTTIIDDQQ